MDFKIKLNPEAHGYKVCGHCNGYGSSLKDPVGVDVCTKCKGDSVVKDEKVK